MTSSKISLDEYYALLAAPDTTEQQILDVSRVVKGASAFDFQVVPDPAFVDLTDEEIREENAMALGNSFCRWRRARKFYSRRRRGDESPLLVSEGDSWFQFPFLIDDVVDHLSDDYLIWSVGAAGDTLDNMVYGRRTKGEFEYLDALIRFKDSVRGFLFSGAGNDIIGEDKETGDAALFRLLRPFNGNVTDVFGHVNFAVLGQALSKLKEGYEHVVTQIRGTAGLEDLPIFVHGYDYVFPYPWGGTQDSRDPIYAKNDEWLGEPFSKRGIHDQGLRGMIIHVLIDALYEMLYELAGDSAASHISVVDCRNAMPDLSDWNDEIHGTDDGFKKVADRFRQAINAAI